VRSVTVWLLNLAFRWHVIISMDSRRYYIVFQYEVYQFESSYSKSIGNLKNPLRSPAHQLQYCYRYVESRETVVAA
jgi:hypothetical protein